MDERQRRESEFHDQAYAEDLRAGYEPVYRQARSSRTFFREWLRTHCAGKRVLELGCGTGEHAADLEKDGADVTGIDISPEAIRQASARGLSARFCCGDAEAPDFPPGSFDVVCGRAILHHLALPKVMPGIARVLSPGGSAIFLEPLGHNPLLGLFRRMTPSHRTVDERPLMEADLDFAGSFFERAKHRYFHLTSLAALPFSSNAVGRQLYEALEGLDEVLFEQVEALRKHAWSVVMVLEGPR